MKKKMYIIQPKVYFTHLFHIFLLNTVNLRLLEYLNNKFNILSPFLLETITIVNQLYPNIKQKVKKENSLSKIYLVGILLNNKKQQTLDTCKEGNGNPLQYSCLENPVDRGAWRAAVHSVGHN